MEEEGNCGDTSTCSNVIFGEGDARALRGIVVIRGSGPIIQPHTGTDSASQLRRGVLCSVAV